jgi:hypothetical protein
MMTTETHAPEWEYCNLGPADSFQGLVGELKAKTQQGWELSGVRNDAAHVYATVKRPVAATAAQPPRAA